jgi:hypothetical protein
MLDESGGMGELGNGQMSDVRCIRVHCEDKQIYSYTDIALSDDGRNGNGRREVLDRVT